MVLIRWETTVDGEPLKNIPASWTDDNGKGPPTCGIFEVTNYYFLNFPSIQTSKALDCFCFCFYFASPTSCTMMRVNSTRIYKLSWNSVLSICHGTLMPN